MSFLAPLFLLGGLAIAAPVIFHLIRRTTRTRTPFSSLMFLQQSPPRLTRRSRLEHILLLLLRCAVLCLLAVGFARPFIKKPMPADSERGVPRRVLVLMDTSASMRRAELWTDAKAKVEATLSKLGPGDQLALFAFGSQTKPLVTFDQWNSAPAGQRAALVQGKMAELAPGWTGTHLGNALMVAAEALADTAGKSAAVRNQIVVVTDLQEGSHLDQLQGYEWPKGTEVSFEELKARHTSNAGIQLQANSEEGDLQTHIRVSNAAGSKRDQFKVGWAQPDGQGFADKPVEIYVPPGQSRTVTLPPLAKGAQSDRILLAGDEEQFDNNVFALPTEQAHLNVLFCGDDPEGDPRGSLYFLKRAFQPTPRLAIQVQARTKNQALSPAELQTAALIIASGELPDPQIRVLREESAAGKTVLYTPLDEKSAQGLAALLGQTELRIQEFHPSNYAMLGEIDFRNPLFAPFADPRFSDFTRIHFWRYRKIAAEAIPGSRVLAKFDNGDPAVIEIPIGKGRLLILTSGWRPEDSQLALSTKFVPLLYSLLEGNGVGASHPNQFYVSESVPLGWLAGRAATVRTPGGSTINLGNGETNFSQTLTPGIYVVSGSDNRESWRFAVNLDAAESRTAPLPVEDLERLGLPLSAQNPTTSATAEESKAWLQNAELESRQKLWRILLIGTLVVLGLETWLGGRAARQSSPVRETGT